MRKYDICGNCPASWCGRNDDWEYRGLGRAVEIVKRGGVDGKIN